MLRGLFQLLISEDVPLEGTALNLSMGIKAKGQQGCRLGAFRDAKGQLGIVLLFRDDYELGWVQFFAEDGYWPIVIEAGNPELELQFLRVEKWKFR